MWQSQKKRWANIKAMHKIPREGYIKKQIELTLYLMGASYIRHAYLDGRGFGFDTFFGLININKRKQVFDNYELLFKQKWKANTNRQTKGTIKETRELYNKEIALEAFNSGVKEKIDELTAWKKEQNNEY